MRYRKNCSVCQYMKKNKEFRLRVMKSTYFNPEGLVKISEILDNFKPPFNKQMFYYHTRKHQPNERILAAPTESRLSNTITLIESDSTSTTAYEIGLDDFIQQGRDQLARKEMPISATTFLTAIRTKADIEKSTKDRKLDTLKAFSGMGSSNEQSNG